MVVEFDFFEERIRGRLLQRKGIIFKPAPVRRIVSYNKNLPEAVFKIASYIKNPASARQALSYISEHSLGLPEPVELFDQNGVEWKAAEIEKALTTLELQKKNTRRQAVHFILSFPDECRMSPGEMKDFMFEYMEPFSAAGFRYFSGIHSHQGAMHAHVFLKLKSDTGQTLRFGKRELAAMRERQVEVAAERGMILQTTRRKDRLELEKVLDVVGSQNLFRKRKDQIVEALDKELMVLKVYQSGLKDDRSKQNIASRIKDLKEKRKAFQKEHREEMRMIELEMQKKGKTLLERQLPKWYEKNGAVYEARRAGEEAEISTVQNYQLDPDRLKAVRKWAEGFSLPDQAEMLFLEMFAENEKTAFWYARNKPDVFGKHVKNVLKLSAKNFSMTDEEKRVILFEMEKSIKQRSEWEELEHKLKIANYLDRRANRNVQAVPVKKEAEKKKKNLLERFLGR